MLSHDPRQPIVDVSFAITLLCHEMPMVSGRKIIETAVRMSLADLSVLLSALQRPKEEDTRLATVAGSDNYLFWSLMTEKGWLIDRGISNPDLPTAMASFSIVAEFRACVHAVAVTCYEGLRQGMAPEEIIAFGEGKPDSRLAHLLSRRQSPLS